MRAGIGSGSVRLVTEWGANSSHYALADSVGKVSYSPSTSRAGPEDLDLSVKLISILLHAGFRSKSFSIEPLFFGSQGLAGTKSILELVYVRLISL